MLTSNIACVWILIIISIYIGSTHAIKVFLIKFNKRSASVYICVRKITEGLFRKYNSTYVMTA